MISMRLPENQEQVFTQEYEHAVEWVKENNQSWSPRKEINMLKSALKKQHMYTDQELHKMKARLRDMYIVNKQLKRGPGFGRAS